MPAGGKGSFKDFLWNSEEKTFLGRTGTSWLKIGVFYVIFYAFLLAFWSLCLVIFLTTISDHEPRWTSKTGSMIGTNPGLGFRPEPPLDQIESTLIMFRRGEAENWTPWVKKLKETTLVYEVASSDEASSGSRRKTCSFDDLPGENEYCEFNIQDLGKCNKENNFGYKEGEPCVLIKLNRMFDWVPEYYETVDELPVHMPASVKDQIALTKNTDGTISKHVWISCEGAEAVDQENIGHVKYYPTPGLASYYFPYTNQQGYLSPMVAVQFINPKQGVLLNIECKAWAKNIHHDSKERRGSVQLQLLVD